MWIEVLGPLAIDGEVGTLGPRDRVVLAALVTVRGEPLTAEQLADALWGDAPPASWPKVVQGCIARLRKSLGREAIETVGHGYRLTVPASELDAASFERSVERIQELLTLGEPHRAVYLVDQALSWWRGRPLVEVEDWEPGRIEAERLEELRRDTEELRLDALLRAGRHADVLAEARARVAQAPLRERRWALLATAQYQAGRQGEALATLREARAVLAEGLGLDPGAELVALEERILRQDPELAASELLPEPSAVCPYLGLVPYGEDDADRFFGRQRDVAACLDRLAPTGVLAIVGPSGSGKSSLVRAGVAASLRRDGRSVVVVTPGARPMDALTSLPTSGPVPVLVVDQCEEAVTLCADGEEQTRFFAALAAHAERAPLVVTVRADRLGDLAAHADAATLVERGLYLLTPMAEDDLRAAIEGPARQAGLLLEGGLVDLLVRDVEGEPGALPLLSHALRQTWLAREGRSLTVAGYQATGGIRGAVAQTAEQVYEAAPADQRPLLRDLLLRLVVPSPEGEPVRNRVPRRMIEGDDVHERIIELLVAARLVTSDEDAIQIAHEALTRAWPRLRGWLDDDVEGQRILRHLATAADAWDAMGRPESELYRGVRLSKALDWRARTGPDLTATERAFLVRSHERATAEQHVIRRRRRTLVGVLAAAAVIATVLGSVAVAQARLATSERDNALASEAQAEAERARAEEAARLAAAETTRAEENALHARARELQSQAAAALDTDPSLAKLLAVAASGLGAGASVDQLSLLHQVYAADPVIARYTWPGEDPSLTLLTVLHPDGERMLASGGIAGPSDRLEVYDLASEETVWSWAVENEEFAVVESLFTPDGELVMAGVMWTSATEADEGRATDPPAQDEQVGVHVLAADTGELMQVIDVGPCGGWVEGVSDRHLSVITLDAPACDIFAAGTAFQALLVERATGEHQTLSSDIHQWAPMSADGRFVAFTEFDGGRALIVVAEVSTGRRVAEIDPEGHGFGDADGAYWAVSGLNPDGSLVVTGGRRVVVWEVATGQVVTTFAGQGGEGEWHAFAPDGVSVYTAARDGGVWQWNARLGDLIRRFPAVGGGRISVGDGGHLLVSTADPRGAALLDVRRRGEVWELPVCEGGGTYAYSLRSAADRAVFGELCEQGPTSYVVDLDERGITVAVPGHEGQSLAVSPDGTRFVRQDREIDDGRIVVTPLRVRDTSTGGALLELDGSCTWYEDLGHPQDGCVDFPEAPAPIWNLRVEWSADDRWIAAVRGPWYGGPGLMVWDAATGELVHRETGCPPTHVAFAPDGDELVIACLKGGLVVLSTDDWTEVRSTTLAGSMREHFHDFAGYDADGTTLIVVAEDAQGSHLHWLDHETLEFDHTITGALDGGPKSYAMSPDRSRVAVGSADGFVRIWDVDERRLVHEIKVGATQVQGLAFVADQHLAVATELGGLTVYTLDPEELLGIVRGSLSRDFTAAECDRFGLADEACITLAAFDGS
jgi:DNA-binding SARP family transcriptional activator/WD40 repeat protein